MSIEQELLELKENLAEAKKKKHQIEGSLKQLRRERKKNFNCKTTKEAKKELKQITTRINKLDDKIETKLKAVKKEFDL